MPSKELTIFCQNLHLLRQTYGYTKRTMAQICGISLATLNKLEQGTVPRRLRCRILFRLHDFFGFPTQWLFDPLDPSRLPALPPGDSLS